MIYLWHVFLNWTGASNTAGTAYGFWSGIGSDFGEITLIAAILTFYKMHECHIDGCHRFGKHPFEHYKLCKKHHPGVPEKITHLHILKLNKQSKNLT